MGDQLAQFSDTRSRANVARMSAATPNSPPPTSELFSRTAFLPRHPALFTNERLRWALRNRDKNGLSEIGAVFESRGGELLIHEPKFIAWFLGLSGRAKPRATSHRGARRRSRSGRGS